jgi:hypothetical protein
VLHPGVGDQDRDGTELLLGRGDRGRPLLLVDDVEPDRERSLPELLGQRDPGRLIARSDHHRGTLAVERLHVAAPHPAGGSGHQHRLSLEASHRGPPRMR